MTDTTNSYWNNYYGSSTSPVPNIPSQFATFTAMELVPGSTVVDIGCGSGRDSLFFANLGFKVVGIDASQAAVDLCKSTAEKRGITNASFICCDADDPGLGERIRSLTDGRIALYARFFLHAIPEETEHAVLRTAAELPLVDMFAIEFRTDRDAQQVKVTDSHYRRFIPPLDFFARAQKYGFAPAYFVEGYGYAKFRQDDAHVARALLRKV